MSVQQDSHDDIKSKTYRLIRLSKGIWESSSLGFIGTYGDPLSNGDAGLVGVDFNYINNEIFNSKQLLRAHTSWVASPIEWTEKMLLLALTSIIQMNHWIYTQHSDRTVQNLTRPWIRR